MHVRERERRVNNRKNDVMNKLYTWTIHNLFGSQLPYTTLLKHSVKITSKNEVNQFGSGPKGVLLDGCQIGNAAVIQKPARCFNAGKTETERV